MKKIIIIAILLCGMQGVFAQDSAVNEEIRLNQYGKSVKRLPLFAEARDGILVFESKNKEYKLWFDIRVQTDGQLFFGKP